MFKLIADNRNPNSLATKLRRRRTVFFEKLLAPLEKPGQILDVGGTEAYWVMTEVIKKKEIVLTLLNLEITQTSLPNSEALGVVSENANRKRRGANCSQHSTS